MNLKNLAAGMPVYVTNKTAEGMIASYTMPAWITLISMLIIAANILLWGGIGIYTAINLIV